ncbi:O-methyltransferase [Terrimonas pollutisoli]|uniref:O-methyltransferase n=1 Tax=Terrimonas pollutisoli TaxID=3034147 RepID=UPI0023EAC082|nr:class I SAM-dependent methyltransferase [Terrimonas sp. H1YJ31]
MHSPFVFDFIIHVLNDKTQYPACQQVEALRNQLVKDPTILEVEDFGAGSSIDKTNRRSVSSIAKNAAKPPKYGQLLYRIVSYYQPQAIIELGTSLGITTSYLSLAKPNASLVTMEGASSIAEKAEQNFKTLNLENITIKKGNFDNTLPAVVDSLSSVDFVFIDGNHRREPTERYFKQLLPVLNNNSIIIFDDIHWSSEMEQAWKSIQQHSAVRCTIDLFFIGIVLLRQEFKEKQHFTIRF